MDKFKDIFQTVLIATVVSVAGISFQMYGDIIELKQHVRMLIDHDGNIRPSSRVLILEHRVDSLGCYPP